MGTLAELRAGIDTAVAAWDDPVLMLDGERIPIATEATPALTAGAREYIVLQVQNGASFVAKATGLLSLRGDRLVRQPLILDFQIATPINAGPARSDAIGEAVCRYWQLRELPGDTTLLEATPRTIGESRPHFLTAVAVGGYRDEWR